MDFTALEELETMIMANYTSEIDNLADSIANALMDVSEQMESNPIDLQEMVDQAESFVNKNELDLKAENAFNLAKSNGMDVLDALYKEFDELADVFADFAEQAGAQKDPEPEKYEVITKK